MSSDPLYTPPSSSSSSGQDPDYVRTVVSDTPSSASPDGAGSGSSPPSQSSGSSSTGGSLSQSFRERYQIIRILGKGGFGTVYLAHDRVLDQHVAIKVLTLTSATGNELKRFIFEARTSAKLRHPAIVNVFDIVQHEGKLQLVMEYYPGGSLSQLIKDKGAIPPVQALLCTRQIAAGLGFAHKNGIIHRDIKPANIFLAGDDIVKLGDFGIAAHAEHHENTMTGEVMGSPLYMSPEQTKDSKNIDGRSDLYSLGLTLYHMLTGEPPRVLDMDDLHPLLRPLLKSVTAFELNDRPANAEEFIQRIDGTLASLYAAGMGNAPGAHPGQPGIAFPYPTGTPTRTAPGTPTPTGTGNALSPTLTAPTPHGTLIPPGYAGPDDVTMTAPAPAAASAQSVKMMMWIIILLMVVVIGGFAAVIGVIRKQSNRPPRSGAAVASVPAAGTDNAPLKKESREARKEEKKIPAKPPDAKGEFKKEFAATTAAVTPAAPDSAANPAPVEKPPTSAATPVLPPPLPPEGRFPRLAEKVREGRPLGLRVREKMKEELAENAEAPPSVEDAINKISKDRNRAKEASEGGMTLYRNWLKERSPQQVFMLKSAGELIETAIKEEPSQPLYHYQLGVVAASIAHCGKTLGRPGEAIEAVKRASAAFNEVLKLDPNLTTPGVGDTREHLRKLSEIDPRLGEQPAETK